MTVLLNDPLSASYIQIFRPRVTAPVWDGNCLRWQGKRNADGYGIYNDQRVHRVVWELFNGPIPADLTIDHVHAWGCRHRDCFRLSHMELVTRSENTRRSKKSQDQLTRTSCPLGHPYDDENTYLHEGHRHCRKCYALGAKKTLIRRSQQRVEARVQSRQPCAWCGGPISPTKTAQAVYCSSHCSYLKRLASEKEQRRLSR